jgi:hypothetical protein
MGAGAKADPTRIQIADVSNTFGKSNICKAVYLVVAIIDKVYRGSSGAIGAKEVEETRHCFWGACGVFHREASSCKAFSIRSVKLSYTI